MWVFQLCSCGNIDWFLLLIVYIICIAILVGMFRLNIKIELYGINQDFMAPLFLSSDLSLYESFHTLCRFFLPFVFSKFVEIGKLGLGLLMALLGTKIIF